jgi:uncharacterized protein (DUF934 family)
MAETTVAIRRLLLRERQEAALLIDDDWTHKPAGTGWLAGERVIVPLAIALGALGHDGAVLHLPPRLALGVLLEPADDPLAAQPLFAHLQLIAVNFPKFTDGRGYSSATLLRRAGWFGPLRAEGDIQRDQLAPLARVGFDRFALRADQDAQVALAAFADFADHYQAAQSPELPYFRRRLREFA